MTAFLLKIIAAAAMLLDHTCAAFPETFPIYFRYIGRLAFPVFAYMIAQGCKHTGNIWKYVLRLGIFAIISEIPYDMALRSGISFVSDTNIYYTLFIGTFCIAFYEMIKSLLSASKPNKESTSERTIEQKSEQKSEQTIAQTIEQTIEPKSGAASKLIPIALLILLMIPVALLTTLVSNDYGILGVACILVFYFAKPENRLTRTIAATCIVTYMYGLPVIRAYKASTVMTDSASGFLQDIMMRVPINALGYFVFVLISVILILLYNGKQGPKVKWAFYAFYPAHLAVLAVIKYIINS